jgi:hypothetical protein
MSVKILINFFAKPGWSQSYRFHPGLGDNTGDARQVAGVLLASNGRVVSKAAFISATVVRYSRGDPSLWVWEWSRKALGSDILVRVLSRYNLLSSTRAYCIEMAHIESDFRTMP